MKVVSLRRRGAGPSVPDQVLGLIVTPISSSQINLSWNPAATAQSYTIRRDGQQLVNLLPGTTFSDSPLAASTTYGYKVSAVNTFGEGLASAVVSGTTSPGGNVFPPSAPTITNLTATGTADPTTTLRLTHTLVTATDHYAVQTRVTGTTTWVRQTPFNHTGTSVDVTGNATGTSIDLQVGACNVSESVILWSLTSTASTQAAATSSTPALRLANSWIGGNQITAYSSATFQQYVSKCQGPILFNWRAGWDSPSVSPHSMRDIMGAIKALATAAGRTPPKTGLYFDATFITPGGVDAKLVTAFNTNFWWLYTVYHSGSLVTSGTSQFGNLTAGSQVDAATGLNAQQWVAAWVIDWMLSGGARGIATAPNVANPNLDFIVSDDGYTILPATGDWNRSGGTSGSATAFRVAYAAVISALRAASGIQVGFNTSQCGAQLGTPPFPEYVGLADSGWMDQMIGTSTTYEYNSSIANFIKDYQLQSSAVKAGGDMVFGHYSIQQSDGSDIVNFSTNARSPPWQGFRHALAAMGVLGNACYYPSLDGTNNAAQTPIWPDCLAVNVSNRQAYTYPNVDAGLGWTGPWVDPPQTAPWQNGVWRRRAKFMTLYWNQRGNGTRTVTFDSATPLQAHYLGVQNPSYDNGNVITGITLNDRDGVILCNQ